MEKILIANRGEIAVRVIQSAKKQGIKTVAVFSEVDREALHVQLADQAICIGEAPASKSYLDMDKIIKAAKETHAKGIHPGYGFLSENAVFAQKVEENGLIFIGPGSEAIQIMGDKLAAKEAVSKYNIPMVPGTDRALTDIDKAIDIAKEIGFPVLIKAAAGGGGKGMRIVEEEKALPEQMKRAISEATSAFGNGAVFIEKYITSPRHIEIQVMADKHGNIIHLFERECSVQRRHQKVVEEAPSSVLTPELRSKMGAAAVNVAKACNYVGAGTVEFLLDEHKNFYFLEMNTRLQVEHPVTEFITGLDLVALQFEVAEGKKLSIKQEDLSINGHALELRVYAEDPTNNFLPSIGTLLKYKLPKGNNVRVDNGVIEGQEVSIYYDPLLSKLISYGQTRAEALSNMLKAIDDYHVQGVATTLPFGKFVFSHPAFVSGNFDTHFVKKYFTEDVLLKQQKQEAEIAAKMALYHYLKEKKILTLPKI
ncbi:MAG: acetyl-CoA carboxylase biotin carboxylase subunit [Flavobacteriales bacterium]|nr:MAG: acetyl-CoA carboxylase biotin carboxylase subunit [Flavobacteriales bacterium]